MDHKHGNINLMRLTRSVSSPPLRLERRLLGNVQYFDDFCLTHGDEDYMQNKYDMRLEQKDNYFVRTYPQW